MRIALFFFSGSGNTYYAAKKLQTAFGDTAKCDLYAIEKHRENTHEIVDEHEMIGLCYPIHGSRIPKIVRDFLETFPKGTKPGFVFCTQEVFSGDGAALGGRALRKKGYDILWQEHFDMPNSVTTVPFISSKKPVDYGRVRIDTEAKAAAFATQILSGKKHRKGSNPFSWLMGFLQRGPYALFEKRWRLRSVAIHEECTKCGTCVALCPTGNLTMTETGVQVGTRCTLCVRCVNYCPEQAITILTKQRVTHPYRGPKPKFAIANVKKDDIAPERPNG